MKLSKKIFITTVATLGVGLLSPSVKAQTAPASSAFTLDQASFSLGVTAPTVSVGTDVIEKGTFTYQTSVGTSDNFSVGTVSAMGSSSSASSTPDYDVSSNASFDVAATSQINQAIGSLQIGETETTIDPATSVETTRTSYWGRRRHGNSNSTTTTSDGVSGTGVDAESSSGSISGTFAKSFEANGDTTNNVTVEGVGTSTAINLGDQASFNTQIAKVGADTDGGTTGVPSAGSAGTASGSASGTISTNTSASASNSQFVSTFIQAY